MTTSDVKVTEGSGKNVATYSITEDTETKQIQRVALNDSSGAAATITVGHGKTIKTVSGSLTADTDVIAAVTSKRIKVIAYSMISTGTGANAAIFKSNGTSGTELWRVILQAPAASSVFGANLSIPAPSFLFATAAGEKLTLDVGNTDTVHYSITYFDDDAS
jgi:hypothetical protein